MIMDESCGGHHQFGTTIRVIVGRCIDSILVEILDRATEFYLLTA
jgi:hypothetical protein